MLIPWEKERTRRIENKQPFQGREGDKEKDGRLKEIFHGQEAEEWRKKKEGGKEEEGGRTIFAAGVYNPRKSTRTIDDAVKHRSKGEHCKSVGN